MRFHFFRNSELDTISNREQAPTNRKETTNRTTTKEDIDKA